MRRKQKVRQNTICLEQQFYTSQDIFTQPLVVMVETFRRSGGQLMDTDNGVCSETDSTSQYPYQNNHIIQS